MNRMKISLALIGVAIASPATSAVSQTSADTAAIMCLPQCLAVNAHRLRSLMRDVTVSAGFERSASMRATTTEGAS